MTILRGTARIVAAITGLLLVYGFTFAMEGMTTRIPTAASRELGIAGLFTSPWLLLFCSGLQDLVITTGKRWVMWLGGFAALMFLFYFGSYTSLSLLTKALMPPIAVGIGLIPHFIRKMGFMFTLASLAAGVAGAFVLYYLVITLLSPTTQFATKVIEALLVAFCTSGITSGAIEVLDIYRQMAHRFAT